VHEGGMAISFTEITLLIFFAQNLTKTGGRKVSNAKHDCYCCLAGGDVSVSTNAICWKPGFNVPS
jgi:hypothetical protein